MEMLDPDPHIIYTDLQPCKDVQTAKTSRDAMGSEAWSGLSEEEKNRAAQHKLIVVNGKRNK
jgi:hypothetical protein